MRPRYYVHMGPKTAEKVSYMWKAAHITIFFLLLVSSSIATACVYNILDMYKFNCIIYARVAFEQSYLERLREVYNETDIVDEKRDANATANATDSVSGEPKRLVELIEDTDLSEEDRDESMPDCDIDPTAPECEMINKTKIERKRGLLIPGLRNLGNIISKLRIRVRSGEGLNDTSIHTINDNQTNARKGYLNMRKTIFSTIYMCDLMLFSPLATIIMAIFLGALTAVGGKGGAGNPGDLLPNPWICVYPFLGLCAFMTIFSFIAESLYHGGLEAFCLQYHSLTKTKLCSHKMDRYNVQFSTGRKGPPKPFYQTYYIGSIGVQLTSGFWMAQTVIYTFRILCLADFSLYLTQIRNKGDEKEPRMANVVWDVMDSVKSKMT